MSTTAVLVVPNVQGEPPVKAALVLAPAVRRLVRGFAKTCKAIPVTAVSVELLVLAVRSV